MRNLFLALLLCPLFVLAGQPAAVSGSFVNMSDIPLEFTVDNPYPDTATYSKTVQPSSDWGFEWKIDLERGTLVNVKAGERSFQLFLEPGDELKLEVDASATPIALEISGKGAENNTFLYDFNKQFAKDFDYSAIAATSEGISIDEFESNIFDQRMKQMRFIKENAVKRKVTPAFNDFINDQVVYNYFAQLLAYSKIKSGDPTGLKMAALPSIITGEMQSATLMDERNMNSPAYRMFVREYVRYETAKGFNFLKFLDYADMLEREYNYALRYLSGEPFKYWIASELYSYCDKTASATVKKLHQALSQSDPQGNYTKPVYAKCTAEITAKEVKKPKPVQEDAKDSKASAEAARKSQPFTLIDLKGNKVYLSDFKGKVIYVDFWASWCGPCRQQFPFAKELHKMLTPDQLKQVVFLYISIDDTEDKWKSAIEKNQIEGFHVNSPGGWGSSVTQHFGVSSIPRYMLIDKKGNVVDPNAKRPSAGPELLRDILMLL